METLKIALHHILNVSTIFWGIHVILSFYWAAVRNDKSIMFWNWSKKKQLQLWKSYAFWVVLVLILVYTRAWIMS